MEIKQILGQALIILEGKELDVTTRIKYFDEMVAFRYEYRFGAGGILAMRSTILQA